MTRNDGRSSINTTCSIIFVLISNDKCRYSLRCFPFGRSCLPFSFFCSLVVLIVNICGRGINKWWNIPTTTNSCGCCGCHSSFSVECFSEKDRDVGEKQNQKSWPYLGCVHLVPKSPYVTPLETSVLGSRRRNFWLLAFLPSRKIFAIATPKQTY